MPAQRMRFGVSSDTLPDCLPPVTSRKRGRLEMLDCHRDPPSEPRGCAPSLLPFRPSLRTEECPKRHARFHHCCAASTRGELNWRYSTEELNTRNQTPLSLFFPRRHAGFGVPPQMGHFHHPTPYRPEVFLMDIGLDAPALTTRRRARRWTGVRPARTLCSSRRESRRRPFAPDATLAS